MLAFDYGQSQVLARDGIEFIRDSSNVYARGVLAKLRWWAHTFAYRETLSGTPLLHEQEYAIWDAASADVYIAFGATGYSARLARWCQIRRRRFVLMHGSDMDLDPIEIDAAYVYAFPGLSVAQTKYQARELGNRFGRESMVLPNPVDIPERAPCSAPREFALWVGKSDRVKCPDRMLGLAHLCSNVPILMIMNRANPEIFDAIKADAPKNVTFIDAVPPDAMHSYYRRAFAFVSTSKIEGFANSFLEAGACGTPILSLDVDPEGMLSHHGAGLLTLGRLDVAATALNEWYSVRDWIPGSKGRNLGENAFRYVVAHHAQVNIFDRFAAIVKAELDRAY
ncbi:glycosyltransferase family 4 protein [Pusillimonas sp. NJUB218]|uniref:glycosyltransferase family 4 protein n=1 Tax=Pusillimonas sp. NJUB218 TaxID=2023230 RepID=UPI0013156603|nr:glycosyltransferase family 4 protein [Pusillimonas sp. NJUB218]